MERKGNPLDYPFLDVKSIMEVFGGVICKTAIYNMVNDLLKEKDEDGNLLVDPKRMPPTTKIIVPTDVFCKRYGIKRRKKVNKENEA